MFCSTIIPTIGRQSLTRAVESVLNQRRPQADFEVIVVNDSGQRLWAADWQRSSRVRILNTFRRERSVARNSGAAVATGAYLHFLDDDDWLLPNALQALWELTKNTQAAWYYGASQLVDREGKSIIKHQPAYNGNCFVHAMAGEWFPLQSSLINSQAFFAVGGFNPLITGPEDIDLGRKISLTGDFQSTQALVSCIGMGETDSTTDYQASAVQSRQARESILNMGGTFSRMMDSASGPYWKGRVARAYLTSSVWNLRRGRVLASVSRALPGLLATALAGRSLLSPKFWRAIAKPHTSQVFLQGFEADNLAVQVRSIS